MQNSTATRSHISLTQHVYLHHHSLEFSNITTAKDICGGRNMQTSTDTSAHISLHTFDFLLTAIPSRFQNKTLFHNTSLLTPFLPTLFSPYIHTKVRTCKDEICKTLRSRSPRFHLLIPLHLPIFAVRPRLYNKTEKNIWGQYMENSAVKGYHISFTQHV